VNTPKTANNEVGEYRKEKCTNDRQCIPLVITKLGEIALLAIDERSEETASSAPTVRKLPDSDMASTSLYKRNNN
jgi:hypothetical protein